MSQTYTIRLNLGGDVVQQLKRAEQLMNRLNISAEKLNKKGFSGGNGNSGIGSVVSGSGSIARSRFNPAYDRFYQTSQRFGANISRQKFDERFNKVFREFDRFSNDFARNSTSIFGWRRNVGNFVNSLNAFQSALGATVPLFGAVTTGLKAGLLGLAGSTAIGGGVYSAASKILTGTAIGNAASDRLQFEAAERGLGMGYSRALRDASSIAAQYGIPRASAVSNLNILTGFKAGDNDISYTQATNLTKSAALISAFSSRPFDIVALNLQQILGVDKPNARDIRELLHQAPILTKYGLQDINSDPSLRGTDIREYYRDNPGKLLANLDRLLQEFQIPRTAEVRGQIELRRRDFYIEAEKQLTPVWEAINDANKRLYNIFNQGLSNFVQRINIQHLETLFNSFTSGIESVIGVLPLLVSALTGLTNLLGLAPRAIAGLGNLLRGDTRSANQKFYGNADLQAESVLERDFNTGFLAYTRQRLQETLTDEQKSALGDLDRLAERIAVEVGNEITDRFTFGEGVAMLRRPDNDRPYSPYNPVRSTPYSLRFDRHYTNAYNAQTQPLTESPVASLYDFDRANRLIDESLKDTTDAILNNKAIGDDLKDIEDLTKGSKALTINFNGPILEMPTTFQTAVSSDEILDSLQGFIDDGIAQGLNLAIHNATRAW